MRSYLQRAFCHVALCAQCRRMLRFARQRAPCTSRRSAHGDRAQATHTRCPDSRRNAIAEEGKKKNKKIKGGRDLLIVLASLLIVSCVHRRGASVNLLRIYRAGTGTTMRYTKHCDIR
jgi:hypothetical protein